MRSLAEHLDRMSGNPDLMPCETSAPCTPGSYPGFVIDTKLEPGQRIVTFGNGMLVREPIVDIDDTARHLVWSAIGGSLTHYNASAQVFANPDGQTRLVWIADLLPSEAASSISLMMEEGMTVTKSTLDRLVDEK